MLVYQEFICVLLGVSVLGQLNNKQQVCMDVEDACSIPSLGSGQNTAQGPPGKRGPTGLPGEIGRPGEKGSAGEMNYDRIREFIQRTTGRERNVERELSKIKNAATDIHRYSQSIKELQREISELTFEMAKLSPTFLCDRSFFIKPGESQPVNYWFPGSTYSTGVNCTFHLTTAPSSKLLISITQIDTEDHDSCSYDHIAFYDGPLTSSTVLTKQCGSDTESPTVNSTGNIVTGWFDSDESNGGQGFKSIFKAV